MAVRVSTQRRRDAEVAKVRLGDHFDLQMGKTPARANDSYWGGTNKWISIADIGKAGQYISETKEYITDEAVRESGIKQIPANTLLMSFKLSIGKATITTEPMYSNEAIMAFFPKNPAETDLHYFYHQISNKDWSDGMNRAVVGLTLNKKSLQEHKLFSPPLSEQKMIAGELDRICELKKNAEERLELMDQLVKSKFVEMFGGDYFNKGKLSACVEQMFIGPFGSSLKNECFVDESDAYCMVYEQKHAIHKDMTLPARYVDRKKYDELRRFEVGPGDIIVSCRGTVGEVFLIPNDAPIGIMHPSIMKIRLKRGVFDNTYFLFALRKFMIDNEHRAQGSGVKMAVTATVLGNEEFVIPPFSLQREFAAFVAEVDKSKEVLKETVAAMETLYKQRLQEYFS